MALRLQWEIRELARCFSETVGDLPPPSSSSSSSSHLWGVGTHGTEYRQDRSQADERLNQEYGDEDGQRPTDQNLNTQLVHSFGHVTYLSLWVTGGQAPPTDNGN